jgi:hypothetical protein
VTVEPGNGCPVTQGYGNFAGRPGLAQNGANCLQKAFNSLSGHG